VSNVSKAARVECDHTYIQYKTGTTTEEYNQKTAALTSSSSWLPPFVAWPALCDARDACRMKTGHCALDWAPCGWICPAVGATASHTDLRVGRRRGLADRSVELARCWAGQRLHL